MMFRIWASYMQVNKGERRTPAVRPHLELLRRNGHSLNLEEDLVHGMHALQLKVISIQGSWLAADERRCVLPQSWALTCN
jgi:hypothetical protein